MEGLSPCLLAFSVLLRRMVVYLKVPLRYSRHTTSIANGMCKAPARRGKHAGDGAARAMPCHAVLFSSALVEYVATNRIKYPTIVSPHLQESCAVDVVVSVMSSQTIYVFWNGWLAVLRFYVVVANPRSSPCRVR